jgi:hypothetical protein
MARSTQSAAHRALRIFLESRLDGDQDRLRFAVSRKREDFWRPCVPANATGIVVRTTHSRYRGLRLPREENGDMVLRAFEERVRTNAAICRLQRSRRMVATPVA